MGLHTRQCERGTQAAAAGAGAAAASTTTTAGRQHSHLKVVAIWRVTCRVHLEFQK